MNVRRLFAGIFVCVILIIIGIFAETMIRSQGIPAVNSFLASTTPSDESGTMNTLSMVGGDRMKDTADLEDSGLASVTVKAPQGAIRAFIASSSDDQQRGLGDRDSLPSSQGMLFPFAHPGDYGFWMKDMRFPIDMVWVLSDKHVAGITRAVSPETYPTIFFPPLAISYVLELNSGDALRYGIATGTQLRF